MFVKTTASVHFQLALLLALLLVTACAPITAPSSSAALPEVFAINRQLGRGVNLGNALEAPRYEGEWGMRLEADYFRLIAEASFDSVRVPIRWSAHAEAHPPYTIDPVFFARVDWVLEQARENGLAAVINMHHYDELMGDPDAHRERFLALWEQISQRYQNQPPTVVFELLNEPHNRLDAGKWNEILARGVETVRRSNPTRAIIVGPTQWNNIAQLPTLDLPDDPNLIVTFHYYDPFHFTHQGAEWVSGSQAWLGRTWEGAPAEQRAVVAAFDAAAAWATAQNRPLYMGEFGAYSKADQASRERWTAFVARAALEREMSFAYWEFGAGFGVYDRTRRAWNEGLLDALLEANQPD